MSSAPQDSRISGALFAATLVVVVGAVLALYARTLGFEFVEVDDRTYVVDNPHLTKAWSWEFWGWSLQAGYAANWHPLTWWSHALDRQLFGLEAGGHHFHNVLLHALNSVLLFFVVHSLADDRTPRVRWAAAFMASLAFAIHPLRAESVAWVAERKDVLSTCFLLLTLLAYRRFTRRPGIMTMALVTLALGIGLMAKPMLVTLPFALLLLDFWPLHRARNLRDWAKLFLEKSPLFVVCAVSCVLTFVAQESSGAVGSTQVVGWDSRAANALTTIFAYLGNFAWPMDLAIFYPHPLHQYSGAKSLVAAAGFLVVSGTIIAQRRQRPWLIMGWCWYLGTLVPVLGLVQVGSQSMADRYTYVPHIGVVWALAWTLADLASRSNRWRKGLLIAVPVALVFWTALSIRQIGFWRNSEALFQRALAVTEGNYFAHNNLGIAWARQGRVDEAVEQFQQALDALPDYPYALVNLARALDQTGNPAQAKQHYEKSLRYLPNRLETYLALGRIEELDKNPSAAVRWYSECLSRDPNQSNARLGLATSLVAQGRHAEALQHLQFVLRRSPSPRALKSMIQALHHTGQTAAAKQALKQLETIDSKAAQKLRGKLYP